MAVKSSGTSEAVYDAAEASVRYTLFDLSGKVVLVTGGNRGIGLAMAEATGLAGAAVAIWGRDPAVNGAAVKRLRANGIEAVAERCDVGQERSVVAATRRTLEQLGRIDACFANAGADGVSPFLEMPLSEWRRILRTNLDGVFLTFREVARHMVARGDGGSLAATSSVAAFQGRVQREHYVAAKLGVIGLVRSLAVELAPSRIRVNAIVPGPVETEMAMVAPDRDKIQARIGARVPLGRSARPEELGGIAVYLASAASSFHTGDSLVVDGGYLTA
jgi:NAD(P)-dependent dehydrogenase (short-subunit alcohol dehydrogenase family)